jgi:hypothetical protein
VTDRQVTADDRCPKCNAATGQKRPDGCSYCVPDVVLTSKESDALKTMRDMLHVAERSGTLVTLTAAQCREVIAEMEPAHETCEPQAPIARIRIGLASDFPPQVVKIYSPGLPSGEHDLYCEPMAIAPALKAGEPR